jgi:hypothetical protein
VHKIMREVMSIDYVHKIMREVMSINHGRRLYFTHLIARTKLECLGPFI